MNPGSLIILTVLTFVLVPSVPALQVLDLNVSNGHEDDRYPPVANWFPVGRRKFMNYPELEDPSFPLILRGISEQKGVGTDLSAGWSLKPWLNQTVKLGQVSGVSVDKLDRVYLFHRGDRVWNMATFDGNNRFVEQDKGPIPEPTVLVFDKDGSLIWRRGSHIFFMPHGITVDGEFNIWVTDVALHQVMKFPSDMSSPNLVLGNKFTPGSNSASFCKPTSVAVESNGDFFVADGYCNSRILKFNSQGSKILEWGRSTVQPGGLGSHSPGPGQFSIPHALTLIEDRNQICVADRENGRVQCFDSVSGMYTYQLISPEFRGGKVYSVAFSPVRGGLFFIVNGKSYQRHEPPIQGYVLNQSGQIIQHFGQNLRNPHDVAVSADGQKIYVVEIETDSGINAWKYTLDGERVSSSSSSVNTSVLKMPLSSSSDSDDKGLVGAILITSACLLFSGVVLFLAFLYTKTRRTVSKDSVSLLPNSI